MTLDKTQLQELKGLLEKTRGEIEAELQELKKSLDFGDDVDSFDEETNEAEEFSNYLSVKKVLDRRTRRIDRALNKIEDSTYGTCEACSNEIPFSFLKKNPDSRLCVDCKKKDREEE